METMTQHKSRQASPITQGVTVRSATPADAGVLARLDYEATLPLLNRSFYEDLLAKTGTSVLPFLEAVFRYGLSRWGTAEDFILLEVNGSVAAGCAVYKPVSAAPGTGPLSLEKLSDVAKALNWQQSQIDAFTSAHQQMWQAIGEVLLPQADCIVEAVAVLPGWRGRGLGHQLMVAAKQRAQVLGAETLGIMVIHGNDAAAHLYGQYFHPYISYHADFFDHQFSGLTKFRTRLSA